MEKIYRVELNPDILHAVPAEERSVLLAFTHFANEINVLSKAFYWAAHSGGGGELQNLGSNAQAMLFARLLCGKLHEGWGLIRIAYHGSALSRIYNELLDEDCTNSLKKLGRYFGRENPISKIRNSFAFHYSPDEIDACYSERDRNDAMQIFLANDNRNTLYDFSEVIVTQAMLARANPDDAEAAMHEIIRDSSRITGLFNAAIGGLVSTVIKRHFGADLEELGVEVLELDGLPDFHDVHLPFFVSGMDDEDSQ